MQTTRLIYSGLFSLCLASCTSFSPETHPTTPAAPVTDGTTDTAGNNTSVTQPLGTNTGLGTADPLGDLDKPLDSPDPLLKRRTFYFAFDSSRLNPADFPALRAHANYLNAHPQQRLVIAGNTDERGSREYNIALGERRAVAVRRFLVAEGVRPAQLEVISYGEEVPLDPAHTEAAWAKNRRVNLYY